LRLLIYAGIEAHVLDGLINDLAGAGFAGDIMGMLHDDVFLQFRLLQQNDCAHMMESEAVTRRAFVLAVSSGLRLYDAATAVLAATVQLPLLVADEDQFAVLRQLAADRAALQLLWLPEFMAGRGQA
jgi:hypothetical protein